MLRCLNSSENLAGTCSEITVLERQRERMKWQQNQQQQQEQGQHHQNHHHLHQNQSYVCGSDFDGGFSSLQVQNSPALMMMMMTTNGAAESALGEVVANANARSVKPDSGLENGWLELGKLEMPKLGFVSSGFDVASSAISRTSSCPPSVAAATPISDGQGKDSVSMAAEKMRSPSFKKRKSDKIQTPKVIAQNENSNKRNKASAEERESKITTNNDKNKNKNNDKNRETSPDSSKENSKASEAQNQKPDYIHVRARRGQATDSHSLAERVRREKISERMKYLQDLVPGCNKITGKAGMLDEIINYVQSLQRQVEFLSMKLAAVNPRVDFNVDDLIHKDVFAACGASSFGGMEMTSNIHGYVQFCSGSAEMEMGGINPPDVGLRRTISAPVSMPHETFLDSSCFAQILPFSTCEADLQNLYNVGFDEARSISTTSFPSQPFGTGSGVIEGSNLKMEM